MYKLLLATLLLFVGCEEINPPYKYPFYAYSAPEGVPEDRLFDAVDIVNYAAGCELVGAMPPGEYVQPIRVDEEHYLGENILGCAKVGSALRADKHPDRIIMVERTYNYSVADVVTVHEIGHTLGLEHVEGPISWIMSPNVGSRDFAPSTLLYFEDLCFFIGADNAL